MSLLMKDFCLTDLMVTEGSGANGTIVTATYQTLPPDTPVRQHWQIDVNRYPDDLGGLIALLISGEVERTISACGLALRLTSRSVNRECITLTWRGEREPEPIEPPSADEIQSMARALDLPVNVVRAMTPQELQEVREALRKHPFPSSSRSLFGLGQG